MRWPRSTDRAGVSSGLQAAGSQPPASTTYRGSRQTMISGVVDSQPELDAVEHWTVHADEWIRWSREPDLDAYWFYRTQFANFLPSAGVSTLEIGCGEGRIARDLSALGHRVTATDITPRLVAAAKSAGSAARYCVADAVNLPFTEGVFDRVIAYNVLMDVQDMPAAISEAARVLTPGGTLTISIVHPFIDRGTFAGESADATFEVRDSYFNCKTFTGIEERGGRSMHFAGWSHPLQDYVAALSRAGLAICALNEPRPADRAEHDQSIARWRRLPLFLWMNCLHV